MALPFYYILGMPDFPEVDPYPVFFFYRESTKTEVPKISPDLLGSGPGNAGPSDLQITRPHKLSKNYPIHKFSRFLRSFMISAAQNPG